MADPEQSLLAEPWQFRATIYFVATLQILVAAYELTRGTAFTVTVGVAVLAGTVGLIRRLDWGRRTSIVVMWLLIFFAVASTLPARIEGDQALGVESPSILMLAVQLFVLCSMALGALHLLAKYKLNFRSAIW